MCHYMELEFSCSTAENPHRLRTGAVLRCDDFLGCVTEEVILKKPGPEIRRTTKLKKETYTIVKIGGDCEKCAEEKTKLISNEERIFHELREELEVMDKLLDSSFNGDEDASGKGRTLRQMHEDRADQQPDTICASGSCKGLAMVSLDGRQGMFCKKHTCNATEWQCLSDFSTTRNNSQYSIYCPAHTCDRLGCGLRIADISTIYCHKHQTQIYMEFASLQ
ncbi:hypothetical protein ACLX1H_010122 [Fusarium chlamydosporum]